MLKYIDEYRDPALASKLIEKILSYKFGRALRFMEVCGTHTMSISRFGLRKALSGSVDLISGPGCPVCVTPIDYMDRAIQYSRDNDNIIVTFGDMFRVPGSKSTLEREKSASGDIRTVYSPLDAIKIAKENPDKRVIFLAVGFETTTPTIAGLILEADRRGTKNIFILCGNKLIPPAMKALLSDPEIAVDGFILPAHVSTMIGYAPYRFVAAAHRKPCVITGFESLDILAGIDMLMAQIKSGKSEVENEYKRFAREQGNVKAQAIIDEVFEPEDSRWRGFGEISASGLALKGRYARFDIEKAFPVTIPDPEEPAGCLCGEVVKGKKRPFDCRLFANKCTPEDPVGACMVSSEGACAAYYKYERV